MASIALPIKGVKIKEVHQLNPSFRERLVGLLFQPKAYWNSLNQDSKQVPCSHENGDFKVARVRLLKGHSVILAIGTVDPAPTS